MTSKSKIEWTDSTWNPATGCTPVSEGCAHCYAERLVGRFGKKLHGGDLDVEPLPFKTVFLHHTRLDQPLRWKKGRRVFVCSMGDLFHEDVPFWFVTSVFDTMSRRHQHTFQVLTKRPERMMRYLADVGRFSGFLSWPLPHVWLGVTVENHARAHERIPTLLGCQAALRFVSCEPLLGPVDLGYWLHRSEIEGLPERNRRIVDWVICGAESGPGRRPMSLDWARSLRDQCVAAGVPFFFKQAEINGKLVKMPELDGRTWAEVPR